MYRWPQYSLNGEVVAGRRGLPELESSLLASPRRTSQTGQSIAEPGQIRLLKTVSRQRCEQYEGCEGEQRKTKRYENDKEDKLKTGKRRVVGAQRHTGGAEVEGESFFEPSAFAIDLPPTVRFEPLVFAASFDALRAAIRAKLF